MEICPSTSSSSSSQWQQNDEWKSNQSWDYWRSSTWTEQKNKVEIISTGRHVATTRSDSDSLFSCSGSCFWLIRVCEQNTFSHCMYRCAQCVNTSHCTHSLYCICGSRLTGLYAQNNVCSFHLSCAMSLAMHSTLSTSSSISPFITGLQRSHTSRIPCAAPREPRGDGFTDTEPRTQFAVAPDRPPQLSFSKTEAQELRQFPVAQDHPLNSGKSKNTGLELYWASIRAWPSSVPSKLDGLPVTLFPTNAKDVADGLS